MSQDQSANIVVSFRRGTSAERIRELVAAQGCTLHTGYDGSLRINVVVVPTDKRQEKLDAFAALPEVERTYINTRPTYFT